MSHLPIRIDPKKAYRHNGTGMVYDWDYKNMKTIKVIYIRKETYDEGRFNLTLDKVYDAIDMEVQDNVIKTKHYNIKCDNGLRANYRKQYFITLAEFRESRINSILD